MLEKQILHNCVYLDKVAAECDGHFVEILDLKDIVKFITLGFILFKISGRFCPICEHKK